MSIINQQSKIKFILQGTYRFQVAQVTGHSKDSFGNNQNTATLLIGSLNSTFKLLFKVFHIVVGENIPFGQ